tara:strand:- start:76 stop:927 length:852 start_codon:yes stop_codon:yes gene_type:complete
MSKFVSLNSKHGLLGWPLERTYSPIIYNYLSDSTHRGGTYELLKHKEINRSTIKQINQKFAAYNVTIPHKENIINLIPNANIAKVVKDCGAANLVLNYSDGTHLTNTDAFGFVHFLGINGYSVGEMKNKKIVILGNGGSAKGISWGLQRLNGCNDISIVSRVKSKSTITYEELNEITDEVDLLINATPVGMPSYEKVKLDIDYKRFKNLELLINLGYGKNNSFLKRFPRKIPKYDGLGMLICQAVESFNAMTGEARELNPGGEGVSAMSVYEDILKLLDKQHD